MTDFLERSALLLGADNMLLLQNLRVAVIGLGGVGCAAAEALCRIGVGHMLLVDHDVVDITNLNRQIFYTREHVGMKKTDVALHRLRSIHPDADIQALDTFYLPESSGEVFAFAPHGIVDAIDTVTAKLHLAETCPQQDVRLVASLGTGNRLDPSRLVMGDIADTSGCGCALARIMRRELRRCGVANLRVLYSLEPPIPALAASENGRHSPGSCAFVPPVAGYLLASDLIRSVIAPPLRQKEGFL